MQTTEKGQDAAVMSRWVGGTKCHWRGDFHSWCGTWVLAAFLKAAVGFGPFSRARWLDIRVNDGWTLKRRLGSQVGRAPPLPTPLPEAAQATRAFIPQTTQGPEASYTLVKQRGIYTMRLVRPGVWPGG